MPESGRTRLNIPVLLLSAVLLLLPLLLPFQSDGGGILPESELYLNGISVLTGMAEGGEALLAGLMILLPMVAAVVMLIGSVCGIGLLSAFGAGSGMIAELLCLFLSAAGADSLAEYFDLQGGQIGFGLYLCLLLMAMGMIFALTGKKNQKKSKKPTVSYAVKNGAVPVGQIMPDVTDFENDEELDRIESFAAVLPVEEEPVRPEKTLVPEFPTKSLPKTNPWKIPGSLMAEEPSGDIPPVPSDGDLMPNPMQTVYCPTCGAPNNAGDACCFHCGFRGYPFRG